jgi:hypothetical protein
MAAIDDGAIPDDAALLRRIHPEQVVPDKDGTMRPSSAAFKDPNLSVDVEFLLEENGLNWEFSLTGFPDHSLVKFLAGAARAKQLAVVHSPIEGVNPGHAEVVDKKTGSIADHLKASSGWVLMRTKPPA